MLLLIIRDGWGINEHLEGNAIRLAKPHCYQNLLRTCPVTAIQPGGEAVGLPDGQMGNSEVGHMNIGAGRVVYQDLPKINRDFQLGEFKNQPVMQEFIKKARTGGKVHLLGLVSDGGVHSHISHFQSIFKVFKQVGIQNLYVHAYMDGRDTLPESGLSYIQDLETSMKSTGIGKVATISGRFYAMDRDKNWDRVQKAYDAMVRGFGNQATSSTEAMKSSYANGVTDEFVLPTVIDSSGLIEKNDHVLFMNFRPDRAREMSFALENKNFTDFPVEDLDLNFVIMTPYSSELTVPVVYRKANLNHVLAQIFEEQGVSQFKIAETEKYAHVTYFLNGGREEPFEGEDRVIIASPKVQTYDLKPEMSAPEVTRKLLEAIHSRKYGFLAVNYANPDMVGHTGNLDAAIQAVKVVDDCIDQLLKALSEVGGQAVITADHGNLDEMIDPKTGQVLTNHSLNEVDFIYVPVPGDSKQYKLKSGGKLADVAPTILHALKIPLPEEMDGDILFES